MNGLVALAWSAGFFEGEGTVRINKGRPGSPWTFGLQIVNTDLQALFKFRDGVFGAGDIGGPYGPYGISKKRTFIWRCNRSNEAEVVMHALWEFLSDKRKGQIVAARQSIAANGNPSRGTAAMDG